MGVIGELNADGTIKTQVDMCAITGRPLEGHMTTQRIKGTNYFYTYISDFQFKLTDEKRTEIEAQVPTYKTSVDTEVSGANKTVVESVSFNDKQKAFKPVDKE